MLACPPLLSPRDSPEVHLRRPVLAALAALASSCAAPPAPLCDESSVVSLVLIPTDRVTNRRVPTATGRWSAGEASGACDVVGEELNCGVGITGALTVEVTAPEFEITTFEATILADGCLVIGQRSEVHLNPTHRFAEERHYVRAHYESAEACAAAQSGGTPVPCCATALFRPDASAEIVVSNETNEGSYSKFWGPIAFTRSGQGDVPETVTFQVAEDGTLVDDFKGWTWTRRPTGSCF